jgi:hypothetical protein
VNRSEVSNPLPKFFHLKQQQLSRFSNFCPNTGSSRLLPTQLWKTVGESSPILFAEKLLTSFAQINNHSENTGKKFKIINTGAVALKKN